MDIDIAPLQSLSGFIPGRRFIAHMMRSDSFGVSSDGQIARMYVVMRNGNRSKAPQWRASDPVHGREDEEAPRRLSPTVSPCAEMRRMALGPGRGIIFRGETPRRRTHSYTEEKELLDRF